jgi:two-component sensor histidine kinase/putative methionine-R-sulfoxide reductase with GAF domain
MPTKQEIIAIRLNEELERAYSGGSGRRAATGQPLRAAFTRFGAEASTNGLSLEETMAIATEALQVLFERIGGLNSDPTTAIAAGIALAAASKGFDDRRVPTISDITADQAAVQLARLNALHQINRAATTNLQLGALLDITVEAVVSATHSNSCAVYLYEPVTDSFALRAAVGLNPASVGAIAFRAELGITGAAAASRKTIVAPDAQAHPAYLAAPQMGDTVYASQVSSPMLVPGSDQVIGVLNILSIDRREFDDDEVAFLETVSGELAMSIQNARMQRVTDAQLRRKLVELSTLQRVSRTVASSLDLPDVLRLITESAVELIDAEAAGVFRLRKYDDSDDGDASPTVEYRTGERRFYVDESQRDQLVLEVISSGAAKAVEMDYTHGQRHPMFCLPLRSARETWGALCLRLRPGGEISDDYLGLLQAFTDSASLAIENAQLYLQSQRSVDTSKALLQEMHHRVRNNLQTVAALLSLQIREDPDAETSTYLREAANRIQAIAAVHDLLSDERRMNGATTDEIARLVVEQARSTLIRPGLQVDFVIGKSDVRAPSKQATVLALCTNELVSNAVNHGFRGRDHGTIQIRTLRRDSFATIEVENDGEKVPDNFEPDESRGLGMKIIQRLVTSDLHGRFTIRSGGSGTIAAITFPIARLAEDR